MLLSLAILSGGTPSAQAADLNPLQVAVGQLLNVSRLLQGVDGFVISPMSQAQFESLAGDVAAAVAMPGADAGLPPGHGRWRVSLGGSRTATESPSLWDDATGERRSALYAPQLLVEVGIGGHGGLGASYGKVPGSDATLYGIRGGVLLFGAADAGATLALRASHSRLQGVEGLDAQSTAVDAVASWGAGVWRPFAGIGLLHGRVIASDDVRYAAENTLGRVFGGIEYSLGALRLGAELGTTDGRSSQTMRLTYSFD